MYKILQVRFYATCLRVNNITVCVGGLLVRTLPLGLTQLPTSASLHSLSCGSKETLFFKNTVH